ncbi:hypothetical protein [Sorangium sp. So ce887]|uniref:hypothetical protein n=1 Tax=Sorangium sp. So ce887 TaxID=3133324 RepID=UPI003F607E32
MIAAYLIPLSISAGCSPGSLDEGAQSIDPATESAQQALIGGERTVTRMIWRVKVGTRPDHMSTIQAGERDSFPSDGSVWYLPASAISGTAPLYRLLSPSGTDHMDSTTPGEGGYRTEHTLGHGFTSSGGAPGLSRLYRTYSSTTGDHGTRSANEVLPAGYADEALSIHGWSRYNNAVTSMMSTTAGGVTIKSNKVAGGAIAHWTHDGTQYINNFDFGRMLQSAMFFDDGAGARNPTEAGDAYTYPALPASQRHGAPLISASSTSTSQSTRALPLEWDVWPVGGSDTSPVVWKNMVLGKDIQLNYNNMGAVARYTTVVTVPAAQHVDLLHIPVAFLRGEFGRFYTYDPTLAAGNRLIAMDSAVQAGGDGGHYYQQSYGGPIVANADGTRAMGMYAVSRAVGGSATHFGMHDLRHLGGTGEFDPGTSALQAAFVGDLPAGTSRFDAWVITGTLADVQNKMQALFSPSLPPPPGCGTLSSGASLSRGQSLASCTSAASLVHQTDGNIVLYDRLGALWHSATFGRSTSSLAMQSDGNLVLYSPTGAVLWNSGTWGHPGASLHVQSDCNLVIYSSSGAAIWNTGTVCR